MRRVDDNVQIAFFQVPEIVSFEILDFQILEQDVQDVAPEEK